MERIPCLSLGKNSLSSPLWPQGGSAPLSLFQLELAQPLNSPTVVSVRLEYLHRYLSLTEHRKSWRRVITKQASSLVGVDGVDGVHPPDHGQLLLPWDLALPLLEAPAWLARPGEQKSVVYRRRVLFPSSDL